MKFSICIDAVFGESDPCASLDAVKRLGFAGFEFWRWWDKDLTALTDRKEALGLNVTACCTKFVSLVDPAQRQAYVEGLTESIAAARALKCPTLISQVGDALPEVPRETQQISLIEGLQTCAPLLEKAGITLVFEPLNTKVDHPGYYLTQSSEAFAIVDAVASERVKVLYDIYHQQIMEGDLINTITANINRIGHFHAAGHPGRHELDTGEIHYPDILRAIEASRYEGWFGIEYFPRVDPTTWLPTLHTWRKML